MSSTRLLLAGVSALFIACSDPSPTVFTAAQAESGLSTFVAAIEKAGLAGDLNDPNRSLTVFAPDNAAFELLLAERGITNGLDGLTAAQLRPIVQYHLLDRFVSADDVTVAAAEDLKVDSLGGRIQLSRNGPSTSLDSRAIVTRGDLRAGNGMIHVIDRVILPSVADIATTHSSLTHFAAAARLADIDPSRPDFLARLDEEGANFTLFGPTNAGFAALLSALAGNDEGATTGIGGLDWFRPDQLVPLLAYHVVSSRIASAQVPLTVTPVDTLGGKLAVLRTAERVTADAIPLTSADLIASNGVVHLVDSVLLPSVTDVVSTSARFSALREAVVAADSDPSTAPKVAAVLDSPNQLTFFAPSNEAFAGLELRGQALTDVLLYHATIEGPIYAQAAMRLTERLALATALEGTQLFLNAEKSPDALKVSDGTVTQASVKEINYFTSNGVIHVIDKVLVPRR